MCRTAAVTPAPAPRARRPWPPAAAAGRRGGIAGRGRTATHDAVWRSCSARTGEAVRRVAARFAALEPQRVRLRPAGVHRREPWGECRGGGGRALPGAHPGRGRLRAPDGGGLGVVPAFADAGAPPVRVLRVVEEPLLHADVAQRLGHAVRVPVARSGRAGAHLARPTHDIRCHHLQRHARGGEACDVARPSQAASVEQLAQGRCAEHLMDALVGDVALVHLPPVQPDNRSEAAVVEALELCQLVARQAPQLACGQQLAEHERREQPVLAARSDGSAAEQHRPQARPRCAGGAQSGGDFHIVLPVGLHDAAELAEVRHPLPGAARGRPRPAGAGRRRAAGRRSRRV
eukprot:gene7619-biopygen12067